MDNERLKRVESLLLEVISREIVSGNIKDPRVDKMVSILAVSASKDLKYAKVYTSYYGDEQTHKNIVNALNHAAGYIQSVVAKQIKMKETPRLTFYIDKSIERGFRITEILNKAKSSSESPEIKGQDS